jgi:E1A-binding protein p400
MHFLMPQIFSSQQDFKEWFSNPFNQSITQNQSLNISVIQKLQSILRPFLLRRLKKDVEKQLPEKVEHIVQCNLSRRQRLLYDEYINSDKTKQTLNDSDFFSIMNVLMQLRKVCNHPDLFEARTIESPFIMQERVRFNFPSIIYKSLLEYKPLQDVNMRSLNCVLSDFESLQ